MIDTKTTLELKSCLVRLSTQFAIQSRLIEFSLFKEGGPIVGKLRLLIRDSKVCIGVVTDDANLSLISARDESRELQGLIELMEKNGYRVLDDEVVSITIYSRALQLEYAGEIQLIVHYGRLKFSVFCEDAALKDFCDENDVMIAYARLKPDTLPRSEESGEILRPAGWASGPWPVD